MIHNKNMKSEDFKILRNLVLVKAQELKRGEVTEGDIIVAMDQNESINDRPTTGTVLTIGPDVQGIQINDTVLWIEQDGVEIEFTDGSFLLLKDTSILGYESCNG